MAFSKPNLIMSWSSCIYEACFSTFVNVEFFLSKKINTVVNFTILFLWGRIINEKILEDKKIKYV